MAPDTGKTQTDDLLYGIHDKLAAPGAFFAVFQHLLTMIVPIVTPGFLICAAIGASPRDTSMILSMSLVISGIATFVQCDRFGPLGAGLLIVQGTKFQFCRAGAYSRWYADYADDEIRHAG